MSAWRYLDVDGVVSTRPCKLFSVVVTTDGSGPGKVELYNEDSAETGQKFATLLCPSNQSKQFHWQGLELLRGLYVDIVEKADYVLVEFELSG